MEGGHAFFGKVGLERSLDAGGRPTGCDSIDPYTVRSVEEGFTLGHSRNGMLGGAVGGTRRITAYAT